MRSSRPIKPEYFDLAGASDYTGGGLSVIPVNAEKKPAISGWKPYQKKQSTREQVKRWELLYV